MFVALRIQHAVRISHIVHCGLCRSVLYFHIYLIKGKIFEKQLLSTKYVF